MRPTLLAILLISTPAWALPTTSPKPDNIPPTTSAALPNQTLSPAVRTALQALSAPQFQDREKALADLQSALASQIQALAQTSDPEAQARIADLLTFQEGLCNWAREVLKLPPDQQKEAFDFGLQPAVLPHLAHLYARETSLRLDAVKALRKNPDPRVMTLLARAIDDREQTVYLAAMEAVFDRPPTDAVADALWNRAVAAQLATLRPQPQPGPDRISFLGRQVQAIYNGDNELYLRTQDNALATDVLVHLKPPQIAPRIKALFQEAQRTYARSDPDGNGNGVEQNVWMYMPSQESMRNAIRIAAALKQTDLIPGLYEIATGKVLQRSQGQMGRQPYFWSNRTWAIALVLQLTDQSPADWNLRTLAQLQGIWSVPAEADERAAVAKLREWWAKDHAKYGAPADTRPATDDPAPLPRAINPQPLIRD